MDCFYVMQTKGEVEYKYIEKWNMNLADVESKSSVFECLN